MTSIGRTRTSTSSHAETIRSWTRERFGLSDETVLVAEVECRMPGCPPIETVIAFWIDERRYSFKIFKPIAAIAVDDLPPRWLKPSLAVGDGSFNDCC